MFNYIFLLLNGCMLSVNYFNSILNTTIQKVLIFVSIVSVGSVYFIFIRNKTVSIRILYLFYTFIHKYTYIIINMYLPNVKKLSY